MLSSGQWAVLAASGATWMLVILWALAVSMHQAQRRHAGRATPLVERNDLLYDGDSDE